MVKKPEREVVRSLERCHGAKLLLASLLCSGIAAAPTLGWAQAGPGEGEYAKDESTEINVKNADIAAVVQIFSRKTKRNYILDDRVKGKISIYLPGRVSAEESIKILDAVLDMKGFTTVPIGDNLWKIVPSKEAIKSTIPTITDTDGDTATAAMVTRLVPLKYLDADTAKQLLTPLVSDNGLINAYTGTNSLIIVDSENNLVRLVDLINYIDIPFSDREMSIIPVEFADAVQLAETLNQILLEDKEGSNGAAGDIRASLREGSAAARSAAAMRRAAAAAGEAVDVSAGAGGLTVAGRGRAPKIIPDERTNSIIIVADEDMTTRVRALVSQLDSEVDLSGVRFYVYRLQHGNAEDLADVLSGLAQGGVSSSSRGDRVQLPGDRNTGSLERGNRFVRTQERLRSQQRTPGRSRSENAGREAGVSSVTFGENISITADPSTNSLIIYASKSDYLKIVELLKELDVKRRQVLVEAIVLEVGIDDSVVSQFEFLTSAGGDDGGVVAKSSFSNNLATLIQDPVQLSNFSLAAASSGTLTLPGDITVPTQTVLLNAAQTNSNVNVLSAPTILATDNEQAEIIVGQNVPFLASTSTSGDNLNNTFNQIDRQDVGITLRIVPQISSGESVRLELFTEVSNVVAATLASELGPTTTVRTSETVVVAKDGQMIVIGGLIGDDTSSSESGIPFLKDVPVLGHLFRTTSEARRRTNLLIFITPRIIKDQFDARESTKDFSGRMEDVIIRNEVEPRRSDVLSSERIDEVSELSEFTGERPSTIRPPDFVKAPAARASNQPGDNERRIEVRPDQERIELRVTPKIPDGPSETVRKTADRHASLPRSADPAPARAAAGSYLVLRLVSADQGIELPFSRAGARTDDGTIYGLQLPDGSSERASSFFAVGSRYEFRTGEGSAILEPIGRFSSASEAAVVHPAIGSSWYILSPFEIMNFGQGPWVRK